MTDPKDGDDFPPENDAPPAADRILYGDQSAHLAFQQQLAEMLGSGRYQPKNSGNKF